MKMETGQLKQSKVLTEIRSVNRVTVSTYRQHMRAGAKFPPIVIRKGTSTIVSGHHRHAAYLEEYGKNHEVEVIAMPFDSDGDMIAFAVKQNMEHGLPMDGITRKRAMSKLLTLGWTKEQLAQLFGISCKRVEMLGGEYVVVRGEAMPVKAGLEHLHGHTVKAADYEAHIKRDVAMPAWNQAAQLARWLESGWVDLKDERNVAALKTLRTAIDKALK